MPGPDAPHVVALDYGMKWNIARHLFSMGCRVTILPGTATADEVLAQQPDGVFLSNGPGDPEPLGYAQETIRGLLGKKPIFGICLGHQLLALACGAKTYKLKFGHRGANQPVLNKHSGRVEITTQNHGFAVEADDAARRTGSDAPEPQRQHDRRLPAPEVIRPSACSITPRPPPARTTATISSGSSGRCWHSLVNWRLSEDWGTASVAAGGDESRTPLIIRVAISPWRCKSPTTILILATETDYANISVLR